jgi:hypothetical protein
MSRTGAAGASAKAKAWVAKPEDDAIEAMKKAAGVARCGLSGKIDCQCNDNTSISGKLKAAAMLSSRGVLIAVPVSGTFRLLQAGDRIRGSQRAGISALTMAMPMTVAVFWLGASPWLVEGAAAADAARVFRASPLALRASPLALTRWR